MSVRNDKIPLWEKITLPIEEAALYTGLGKAKLYEMTNSDDCSFVLWIGKRRLIKREAFEEYITMMYSI